MGVRVTTVVLNGADSELSPMDLGFCPVDDLAEMHSKSQNVSRPMRLPQELADMVVDFLHDDKRSLATCTLVSYDWLWSARYHLFYTIEITTLDKGRGFDPLLETLSSSSLQLGYHIRCLHIRGAHDEVLDNFALTYSFLRAVLPKLRSIRKVILSGMVWSQANLRLPPGLEEEETQDRRQPMPMPWELGLLSLKDIRLEASESESLVIAQRHFSYLFQIFSSIRLLSINTVRIGYKSLYSVSDNGADTKFSSEVDDANTVRNGRCRIKALNCFTEDDSLYLLAALTKFGLAGDLQTLKFSSGCPDITASAQTVVNLAASSLRSVRYRVPSDEYIASKIPVLDLSQCDGLHTVHLRSFMSTPTEARTILDQMVNNLVHVPPGTLAIILEVYACPRDFDLWYDSACQERWSRLDHLLAERSELRRVVVLFRTMLNSNTLRPSCSLGKLDKFLPILHRKGRLRRVLGEVRESIQWHELTGL